MEPAYAELLERLGELEDLRCASEILGWDQQVMMPRGGAAARADQLATLTRIAHERFVDPRLGELLEELGPYETSQPFDSVEASVIRVTRRDYGKALRVPTRLAAEQAKLAAEAQEAWVAAREASDYASFRPWLDRMLELKREYVECFAPYDDPYDPLLDDFEPGVSTSEVDDVFATLEQELVPLVSEAGGAERDGFMSGPFPVGAQREFCVAMLEHMGYTPESFRLDDTVHPFCSSSGTGDIRLTSRYDESELTSLFTALHECGHGVYEHGFAPELARTPLAAGASSAFHESQSRLWENVVGRSRPFWDFFFPRLQQAFPEALGGVTTERFHRAVNRVTPSLIRVDADEATYSLHVIVRFGLERELLKGSLSTADLPEAWNARYRELLGVEVPNDRLGVLQDVHWSAGLFGYFPTYALGNVIGLQIWERVRADLSDVDEQIARGDLHSLHDWLREHVYRHGRTFMPRELLERLVGGGMDAGPYVRYLRDKLGALAAA